MQQRTLLQTLRSLMHDHVTPSSTLPSPPSNPSPHLHTLNFLSSRTFTAPSIP